MNTCWIFMILLGVVTASPVQNNQEDGLVPSNFTYHYPANSMKLEFLGDKKYLFSTEPATYFEAMYFCNAFNMDLLTIETRLENDLIKLYMFYHGLLPSFIWTSGNKIGRSSWLWVTGEKMDFSNWGQDQPSNLNGNCMFIKDAYSWANAPCHYTGSDYAKQGFICEERLSLFQNLLNKVKNYF